MLSMLRMILAGCLLTAGPAVGASNGYLVAAGVPAFRFLTGEPRLPLADVLPPLPKPEPQSVVATTNLTATATNAVAAVVVPAGPESPNGPVPGPSLPQVPAEETQTRDVVKAYLTNGIPPMPWMSVPFYPPQPPPPPSRATYTITPKTP